MPELPPRCPSFFESDDEYPDLQSQKLGAKRYLRLIYSADYRTQSCMDEDDPKNIPLPANLITIGRRLTPVVKVKILRALDILPVKYPIRVYQLFAEVKAHGYRYDPKHKNWEFR